MCFHEVAGIVPAHLALALQAGVLSVAEARCLHEEIGVGRARGVGGDAEGRGVGEELSDTYVDFHRAIRGLNGATAEELVERFAELMSFEDFTVQFGEMEGRGLVER